MSTDAAAPTETTELPVPDAATTVAALTISTQLITAQLAHQAASLAALRAQVTELAEALDTLRFEPVVETDGLDEFLGFAPSGSTDDPVAVDRAAVRAATRAPLAFGLGGANWWVPIATSVIQPLIPVLQQALLSAILRATGAGVGGQPTVPPAPTQPPRP